MKARLLATSCVAVLTLGCAATSPEAPPESAAPVTVERPFEVISAPELSPAERFLFASLRTAGEHRRPRWATSSLVQDMTDLEPGHVVVRGRIGKVRPGRGYITASGLWGPAGLASGPGSAARPVGWNSPQATMWVARLTVEVAQVRGLLDPPPRLMVALVLNRPMLGVLRRAAASLEDLLFLLDDGGRFAWAPRLRPIRDGVLVARVDSSGLHFPALGSDSPRYVGDLTGVDVADALNAEPRR